MKRRINAQALTLGLGIQACQTFAERQGSLPVVAEALGRAECIARVRARMPIETARRSSNS